MRFLKSKFIFRIGIFGLCLSFIAAAIFYQTYKSSIDQPTGQVAGTATNPLLIPNKFCDDPANPLQKNCRSFISTALAQGAPSIFQNVSGPVDISGLTNISSGVTPASGIPTKTTLQVNNGYLAVKYNAGYNSGSWPAYGSYHAAIGWNFTGGGGEVDFWNTASGGTPRGFKFRQQTATGTRTELMTISGTGGVGIGTNPNTGWPLALRNLNSPTGKEWYVGPDSSNNFVIYRQSGPPWGVSINDGGTGWNANSDQRLKKNIQTLSSEKGLAAIEKLNPVSFNWKDLDSSTAQLGFIAQEVQEVFPELVSEGPSIQTISKPLGLNYTGLIPALVKAIQEQQQEIDQLKQEIQLLKNN